MRQRAIGKEAAPRVIIQDIELKKLPLSGEWRDLIGLPEMSGTWIIWGRSFSGKTSFCVRLAKEIAALGERVAYVSLEEGLSVTMQAAFRRENMDTVNDRLRMWYQIEPEELVEKLKRQRSARVVIIDSLQYLGINYAGYKRLRKLFPNKLFIFVSHANEQKEPSGATAIKVRYDASVKILVAGFVAYAFSRYGGGKPLTIWEEGAKRNTTKKGEIQDDNNEEGIESDAEDAFDSEVLCSDAGASLSGYVEGDDADELWSR